MMMMEKRKLENDMEQNSKFIMDPSKTCLCDDIISSILLKLPVKSLIRFTSVSKSWNTLIHSPTFITTYNKSICHRYLLYTPTNARRGSPFLISTRDEQRINIKMPDVSDQVVGSCKGLVCVRDSYSQVCLWNSLLQTYKIIPPSPSQGATTANSCIQFGFGYSCDNNDYKIVKIIYSDRLSSSPNKVDIYSLKFDSWKSISSTAPAIALGSTGVYINGRINWMVALAPTFATRPVYTIMWFDIDKESFGETDFSPEGWRPQSLQEPDKWLQLDVVKELLRSVTIPKDYEEEYHCSSSRSLWKMKALACENSRVMLVLNWRDQLEVYQVMIFDGEILLRTYCKNLINFLGFNAAPPWKEEDLRTSVFFNVVCVSESLMLLGHRDESS